MAQDNGAITSDSLRLWVNKQDISRWTIDSIWANSGYSDDIGVKWSRPAIDSGTDTIFIRSTSGGPTDTVTVAYPGNTSQAPVPRAPGEAAITVRNAYASSRLIMWAPANYETGINLYERGDSNYDSYSGLYFANSEAVPIISNNSYCFLADLILATDSNNNQSGSTIISPSVSSLSGYYGGRKTAFYHPIQFIDSGYGLQELYYSNDLSTYVNGVTPLYEIPLPDSSQYSTAFIAVTQDGHYAQVEVGPVSHDWNNFVLVPIQLSYQTIAGLPYSKAHTKSPAKH